MIAPGKLVAWMIFLSPEMLFVRNQIWMSKTAFEAY